VRATPSDCTLDCLYDRRMRVGAVLALCSTNCVVILPSKERTELHRADLHDRAPTGPATPELQTRAIGGALDVQVTIRQMCVYSGQTQIDYQILDDIFAMPTEPAAWPA
jgi:hypothetical protein